MTRSKLAHRLAFTAAAALVLCPEPARATGMQGHIYMAQCAAEQVTDARLRALFDNHPTELANGAFLVDSGYITDDGDQGEIPHWEGFIEAHLQLLRESYPAPYDSPEAAAHVAVLMGMAAHGITDSTFDSLFYARADQVEPSPTDSFDTAMDVFLVADMPRYYIPDFAYDVDALSETFTRVNHPVAPDKIKSAISTARSGIAAVSELLYKGADDYGKKYPWGRAHFLDGRTPGGYAFGAGVVMGYYRELLRRLDGDTSADQIVIGTYPNDAYPMVTTDASRPDGKVALYFGHGLDRASIDGDSVAVTGPGGMPVPVSVEVFRGDQWANVLLVQAAQDWLPATTYQVVLRNTVQTLYAMSPKEDFVLSFTTCAAPDETGSCPAPEGPAPLSACPKTEAQYAMRPGEGSGASGGSGGAGGSAGGSGGAGGGSTGQGGNGVDPAGSTACGCTLVGAGGELSGALLGVAGVGAGIALARRRRRRARAGRFV